MMRAGSDGSGRALREVMAMGKPAIVSDVGMLSDFVEDGKNGYVAKWDEHDLAEKMEALVTDDAKRKQFGENAKETASREMELPSASETDEELLRTPLTIGKKKVTSQIANTNPN